MGLCQCDNCIETKECCKESFVVFGEIEDAGCKAVNFKEVAESTETHNCYEKCALDPGLVRKHGGSQKTPPQCGRVRGRKAGREKSTYGYSKLMLEDRQTW